MKMMVSQKKHYMPQFFCITELIDWALKPFVFNTPFSIATLSALSSGDYDDVEPLPEDFPPPPPEIRYPSTLRTSKSD